MEGIRMQHSNLTLHKTILLIAISVLLVVGLVVFQIIRGSQPASAQASQAAAVDYFLKLDGIEGEATDRGHEKEIVLESYDWAGISNEGSAHTGGGAGAGKAKVSDISFTKNVDKSTPQLLTHVATGKHIKEAVLTVRKSGEKQQDYLIIKFEDVIVSQYKNVGGSSLPTDSFSLNFSKVTLEYKQQDPKGELSAPFIGGYDIKKNDEL
jgi:type VI secretion system secreted protein Hcp